VGWLVKSERGVLLIDDCNCNIRETLVIQLSCLNVVKKYASLTSFKEIEEVKQGNSGRGS
jgi:hypothetical protein